MFYGSSRFLGTILLISIFSSEILSQADFKFDDYYEGGEQGLYSYFSSTSIKYPNSSISSASIGLSVSELVLSSKGKILAVNIINPIDKQIDSQIIQGIKGTEGQWKKHGNSDTIRLYFQFRFRIITDKFNHQNYQFIANDRFLLPVFITTIEYDNDAIILIPDDSLAQLSDKAIYERNYGLAVQYLDEMIRRNPYYLQLYQLRISVNSKLKNSEQIKSDLNKITNFADGIPMNQIIIADYKELKQIADSVNHDSEGIFMVTEQMPEYPGGEKALYDYLRQNLNYPVEAKKNGIQGSVYVIFIVDIDGYIKDIRVLRGIGGGCDKEAVRLIENMPRWKPAIQDGDPVKVQFNIPIRFSLN
ncbi:MAG: energy transducer TonB [Bacteroidales bacterium]|nr:energy transducer TonB [Bacteroidales bacterium]